MSWFDFLGDLFGGAKDFVSAGSGDAANAASDAALTLGPDNYVGTALKQVGDVASGAAGETVAGPSVSELGDVAKATGGSDWASRLWGGASGAAGKAWDAGGDVAGGFSKFAKGALPFAQVGAEGFSVANAIKAQDAAAENNKRIKEAFALQERAAVPLTNFGETQIKNAQAGNVPTAVQAQIDQWAQGAKVKARDYLARAGISDSSAAAQWDAYIDQQAQAMKASALQSESQQGIDALGKGANVAAGVGNQAGQQQTSLETLIASANQQLARLSGAAA